MKERPILFNEAMVRAIIQGRKTQTRRMVGGKSGNTNVTPTDFDETSGLFEFERYTPFLGYRKYWIHSPYGQVGDRLWVREPFDPIYPQNPNYNGGLPIEYDYKATYTHGDRSGDLLGIKKKWKPSIHMPRNASRITLEITNVRVERLQDISEEDAAAEGGPKILGFNSVNEKYGWQSYIEWYQWLWESINGAESWAKNPWVWVIEFKRVGG